MRSPFTGIRFARLEFDNFRAGKMIKLAIIAVSLIPLIYGGLFLLAFLDPYGGLVNVPAAVVNQDEGAKINDEQRNIGQELCDQLVKNNNNREEGQASGYNWQFVDQSTAQTGLEDATYYMELIIPKDFSKNIASADSDDPQKAQLQVYFNPSTNLIAQTVGQGMVTKIKLELTNKIEKSYFKNIFVSISDASDQMKDAVDGSKSLSTGIDSAKTGSDSLATGVESAKNGSAKITKNLKKLSSGAKSVDSGVSTLASKMTELKQGIKSAQSSTADLGTLIQGVADALQAYQKTGTSSYLTTATELAAKVKTANPTIGNDLYKYIKKLTSSLATYQTEATASAQAKATMTSKKKAMDTAQSNLSTPTSKLQSSAAALQSDLTSLAKAEYGYQQDSSQANSLLTAAKAVVTITSSGSGPAMLTALNDFQTALKSYESAASEYQTAATDYSSAATKEATAAAAASKAQGTITGYLTGVSNTSKVASASTTSVSSAVSQLLAAVKGDLSSGTSQVASGASKIEKGSNTLTLGLADASSGANSLSSGLSSASSGASELYSGLKDGQEDLSDSVTNKDAKSKMMAKPVVANGSQGTGESITEVKNYGTGFAPYFIGLGMWVGALMVSFLIRALNSRILMSGASTIAATLSSYIPMAIICIVQAMLLLLFIQFVLGMTIKYPIAFYLFGILTACCFAAIIQFFRATLGTVGLVVIVVLLMLQLCTAAGTFPIESEITFFQVLNPYLPMTYVVGGFRMAMAGLSLSYMGKDVAALFIFWAAFLVFTFLYARYRRRVTMTTLYPPLQLS